MQARARRLQCASQLQETKTVFARTKDSIENFFSLSRKARNKFIHALNGNTTSAVWSPPALVFGLMKQLCSLAAGNPDAGRDDSGKKIDGLTWISPEWALRMFDLLVAGFFVKARNDDEKKIDGSSKLRSAVQRCAQFARVGIELGRTYSGVETCEGTSERFVETICLLSRKARNKFIHAMNGNTVDTKGRETAARKATTNVNKKWITFLAEMIDYDKKKALAILANGKTNLRELMDEIKVAKTSENQKAILDKYHEAGRRKRQESGKTVNDSQNKTKKKKSDTTANSTVIQNRAYDNDAQLRDVLNAKILQPGFNHEDGGVYVLRNDAETIHYIKLLHKREQTLPTLHLLIPTTSVSDEVKVVARLHKVDPGPFQLPMVRKLMDQEVHILREGYLWTTGVANPLKMRTAPVVMKCKATDYENVNFVISEYHDNEVYNSIKGAVEKATIARIDLQNQKLDRDARRLAGQAIKNGKETMTAIIKAKIQKVIGSAATLEQQEVTVNSIKIFEGEGQGAKQVKVDATINASVSEPLRRASGQDAILVTTCGYDEKGKARDKERERWIPAGQDTNGSTPTRADVWQTLLSVTPNHYGLHLNTDGKTFKLRVPNEEEEQGWERVHSRRAPARRQYIVERAPSNIPVHVIVRRLRDDLHWEVEDPRPQWRGKGSAARRRIFVKAKGPPPHETTQIDDVWILIREDSPNKTKDNEDPKSKFFGKFDETKATRAVAQAGATDMERAQAAAMVDAKVKQGTVVVNMGNRDEEMESEEDENMEEEQRSPFEKAIDDSWKTRVQSLTQADQARWQKEKREVNEQMQKLIAQTNQHTQEQTALVKQEVERATHELQQQTTAKDVEIEKLRKVAEMNDKKIDELRQQAMTATQAAQAAKSAAEASHVGVPTELQMMLAAMQEMVADVRSMRDEIINKKQKTRHVD